MKIINDLFDRNGFIIDKPILVAEKENHVKIFL